jgi:hypothetical protein
MTASPSRLCDLEAGEIGKLDLGGRGSGRQAAPGPSQRSCLDAPECVRQCRTRPRYEGFKSQYGQWPIRITIFYRRFAAVPCDTTPTLPAEKYANFMKLIGYYGHKADPHYLKAAGSEFPFSSVQIKSCPRNQISQSFQYPASEMTWGICIPAPQVNNRSTKRPKLRLDGKRWGGRPPGGIDVPRWRVLKHRYGGSLHGRSKHYRPGFGQKPVSGAWHRG